MLERKPRDVKPAPTLMRVTSGLERTLACSSGEFIACKFRFAVYDLIVRRLTIVAAVSHTATTSSSNQWQQQLSAEPRAVTACTNVQMLPAAARLSRPSWSCMQQAWTQAHRSSSHVVGMMMIHKQTNCTSSGSCPSMLLRHLIILLN